MSDRPASETFGARLRRLQAEQPRPPGWDWRRAGLIPSRVCRFEANEEPGVVELERLADVFGVTMDYLWRGTKP